MNILIVEDDRFLARKIWEVFEARIISNRVRIIHSYMDFIEEMWVIRSYDIVLTDLKLSDERKEFCGYKIIRDIREKWLKIPIVVISGFGDIDRLQLAFEYGASDYIIKPFRLRELELRILNWFKNYCLTNSSNGGCNGYEYRWLSYDLSKNEFFYQGEKIGLTKQSKYILSLLLAQSERLVSDTFLTEKIWGDTRDTIERNLRVVVLRLKQSLLPYGIDGWIRNVRGEGYVLSEHG